MKVSIEILERLFVDFTEFVNRSTGEPFSTFKTSESIKTRKKFKYLVYNEARENLASKLWKSEDIGTGLIQQKISSAIQTSVNHKGVIQANILVNWRKKDNFKKIGVDKSLEETLFNFYKNKIRDQQAFEDFMEEKLDYQLIAYLFFIKDSERFMPISQVNFDRIFELLGLPDFKTSGKVSWENYMTFMDIIKQVRSFLQTKDPETTLLDAHSFLWTFSYTGFNSIKKLITENN